MRSLKHRFDKATKTHAHWSSYLCFCEAIKGQSFSQRTLHQWFHKLVEKDDYGPKDRKDILAHLGDLTKPLEDNKKQG